MPEEKKPKAEEEEEKKKAADNAPRWAIELGAKIDKMTDALLRFAEVEKAKKPEEEEEEKAKKPEEEEEKKAKKPEEEEEKQADKYPKPEEEEEKQKEPEKYPYKEKAKKPEEEEEEKAEPDKYPKEEEKLGRMIENAVDMALQKRFTGEAEKRSKVPSETDEVLDYARIAKLDWKDVEKLAEKLGAPGSR